MARLRLVKLIMIFRRCFAIIIFLLVISCHSSCNNCNKTMYFKLDYLYPKQKVKLIINDELVYKRTILKFEPFNALKQKRYCSDMCLDKIKSKNIKVYFQVNNIDTLLILDSEKISGVYLGYGIDENQLNVLVDSTGKGLFWGERRVGFE